MEYFLVNLPFVVLGGFIVFLIFHKKILSDSSLTFLNKKGGGIPTMSNIDMSVYEDVSKAIELERKLLGFDVHDELAPFLSSLHFDLQVIKSKEPYLSEESRGKLKDMLHKNNQAIESLRRIINGMLPHTLESGDINFAISEFCLKYDGIRGRNISFFSSGEPTPLASKQMLHILRITQELVNNAVKHSLAWSIQVSLHWTANNLRLLVKDDGQGFTENQTEIGKYGVTGIFFRARLIGATATFNHSLRGTEFELSLPLTTESRLN